MPGGGARGHNLEHLQKVEFLCQSFLEVYILATTHQLISEPTRVTNDSKTLIDHNYTNNENNIQSVNVEKICISDHYGIFRNRSTHVLPDKNDDHQTIIDLLNTLMNPVF